MFPSVASPFAGCTSNAAAATILNINNIRGGAFLTGNVAAATAAASSSSAASTTNELVAMAYDWCINLGAPAALVAGATVATLYENVRGGALDVYDDDSSYVAFAKKTTNMLLVSAFGLQIISIFVTTVLSTVLVTRDLSSLPLQYVAAATTTSPVTISTPLGFLRVYFEFEYLTARISFLQGLLNWLAGVALEHTIPRRNEGRAGREMDQFVASSLGALLVMLLAFYNTHLTFYDNYLHMLWRWLLVFGQRFFTMKQQLRPLALLYVPLLGLSIFTGIRLLWPEKDGNLNRDQPKGPESSSVSH